MNDSGALLTSLLAGFEAFTAVKIHVEVFWILTPCSVVIGYQRFRGSMDHWNFGIVKQHYTASQSIFILKMEEAWTT